MALRKFLCSAGDDPGSHQSAKASPKVINVECGKLRNSSKQQGNGKRRGTYQKFSDATIGKFASEHGVARNTMLLRVALETGEICIEGNYLKK